jgi:ferredoxin
MSNTQASSFSIHYVSTLDDALKLIEQNDAFWLANCGCRESRGHCDQSRMDVCLQFSDAPSSGSSYRQVTKADALEVWNEAKSKLLVARPFRDMKDKNRTDGICFCCKDCCGYFSPQETFTCDKGDKIEMTDMAACTHCGQCVEVCYFDARKLAEGLLRIDRSRCFGCGLCIESCPERCISLETRD